MRGRWSRISGIGGLGVLLAALPPSPVEAGAVLECESPAVVPVRSRVELTTEFGVIRLELLDQPGEAPLTVANFLGYVERGDYDGSFFHRLVADFVLQGGGFFFDPVLRYEAIPTDPPVDNEYKFCNTRGTVAMAKVGGQPNSATSQFFINLIDNSMPLENENGGFTVFAQVVPADMAVVDAIAGLHTEFGLVMVNDPLAEAFRNLPVKNILERPPNGFGCLKEVDPDPHPETGPTSVHDCDTQAELNAAAGLWRAGMDPLVPPELVVIETVPEPGAALLLAAGAATLALRRLAARRRLS